MLFFMQKKKATIYADADLLRAVKIQAAREDKADYQVIEDALRAYLGFDVLDEIWSRSRGSELDEQASLDLAYKELRAVRKARRKS